MAQPYKNNKIRDTIKQLLNLEMYQDKVPAEIEDRVQLVIDVNPFRNESCDIVASNSAINSTSQTIYTTPTDKDFYICGAVISVIKDVTSTSIYSRIAGTIAGATVLLLSIPGLTLTIQQDSVSINFSFPIKIDAGTNILIENSTNVGNVSSRGIIYGFTSDNKIYDMGIGAQK